MSGRSDHVGFLPALGSGLTDLARTGQHDRLLDYDLRHYAESFGRVTYFSYFDEKLSAFTRDPRLLDRVDVIPNRRRWRARVYALALPILHWRAMRRCGALRVLQFTGVLPALIARAIHGTPFVVTYGYDYREVARLTGSRLKPLLLAWLERVALPRAAAVIVTSPEMRDRLERHPARPRLAYFPNGADLDQFAPMPRDDRQDREGRVLYAGRLEAEKNVAALIDALATIRAPRVRLIAIGDGSLREALGRRAAEAGVAVDFRGVVPHGEMPRHLGEADCFVLPSLTEGHPKALIEAMACGLPCAASARGGIPAMIEDGVTGLLFDPERPADIARAIARLLTDAPLAARLGSAARREAMARYDARTLLAQEAAFVRAVARGETPSAEPARALAEDYAVNVPMDGPVPDFVADRLRPMASRPPRAVLDIGAGDGRFLDFYAALFPKTTGVIGCELSLVRARRLAALGHRVVVAAAEALPFREGAFDLVTLMEVIEHTSGPARALDEAHRVLEPGGRLVLTTPNYPMKRLFDARAALRQRRLSRFHDDPTHISPFTAARLERLLRPRFASVELEGTAVPGQGHWRRLDELRTTRVGRRLSNKLFAVCTRGKGPRATDAPPAYTLVDRGDRRVLTVDGRAHATAYSARVMEMLIERKGARRAALYLPFKETRGRHFLGPLFAHLRAARARDLSVLEIGCSFGHMTEFLDEQPEVASITAFDTDPSFAAIARAKADELGLAKVRAIDLFDNDETRRLPYATGAFDLVIACGVVEHLPVRFRRAQVDEYYRVLAPGGRIAILDTPNRAFPLETHSVGLPLVQWLPARAALAYARLARPGRFRGMALGEFDADGTGWRNATFADCLPSWGARDLDDLTERAGYGWAFFRATARSRARRAALPIFAAAVAALRAAHRPPSLCLPYLNLLFRTR